MTTHLVPTLRSLARRPGFTAVVVLTLALGIGANTAVFSVVNALLLRPMPAADLETLAVIFTNDRKGEPLTSSYPDARDIAGLSDVFSGVTAHRYFFVSQSEGGDNRVVPCQLTTANYFSVLGLQPALGRGFTPDEDVVGSTAPVAIVSHAYWQQQLGGDPGALGKVLTINGRAVPVVGVAPPDYRGPVTGIAVDLWLPLAASPELLPRRGDNVEQRGSRSLAVHGRLRPGVTIAQARTRLEALAARLGQEYPETNRDRGFTVLPAGEVHFVPMVDKMLAPIAALLMLLPGLLLLVACSNVGSLILSRTMARRREVAIRASLGATRMRLASLVLLEAAVLAVAGAVLGGLLAWLGVRALLAVQPSMSVPIRFDVPVDVRVLGFTLLASLVTMAVAGLTPARRTAQTVIVPALRGEEAALGRGRRLTFRRLLVGVQVAASVTLLVGAGWFVRSLGKAQNVDPGFETEHAVILNPGLIFSNRDEAEIRALVDELTRRVGALPGVTGATVVSNVPLGAGVSTIDFFQDGVAVEERDAPEVDYTLLGSDAFTTLRIPIVRGRAIGAGDGAGSARVAVVSEALAKRFWPDREPLGQRFRTRPGGQPIEVVGVARDIKVRTLGEAPRPFVYLPFAQRFDDMLFLVAATDGDPAGLLASVRQEVLAVDPSTAIMELTTMRAYLQLSLFPTRVTATMLTVFGALGLALACLGLYGLVSHSAAQRSREVAIRVAMGSSSPQVLALVAREGIVLVVIGAAAGLVLAMALSRPVSAFLVGVSPFDPFAFAGLVLALAVTTLVACLLPARRASRVDPMSILRAE